MNCIDAPIEHLKLSSRSSNCLHRAGYHYIYQLEGITKEQLSKIKYMGKKSVDEIIRNLSDYNYNALTFDVATDEQKLNEPRKKIEPLHIFCDDSFIFWEDIPLENMGIAQAKLRKLQKIDIIYASQLIDANEKTIAKTDRFGLRCAKDLLSKIKAIYFNKISVNYCELNERHIMCIKRVMKQQILARLFNFVYGAKKSDVYNFFSFDFINNGMVDDIIHEMELNGEISITEDRIECCRMTLCEYLKNDLIEERQREIIVKRIIQGKTYNEIGKENSITGERVRQIIKKYFVRKREPLKEDRYKALFEKYEFLKEDFIQIFGEKDFVYNYLKEISEKNDSPLPLKEMLNDETMPEQMRHNVKYRIHKSNILNSDKNSILVNGERVNKIRKEIVLWVARTYFQNEGTYSNFKIRYIEFLNAFELSNDLKLHLPKRFDLDFSKYEQILWCGIRKGEKIFRYYDTDRYNVKTLLNALNLEQYKNVNISTLKLFIENEMLMMEFNIKNELELHNLLKKQCKKHGIVNIYFSRIPMIEFGNYNKIRNSRSLLLD